MDVQSVALNGISRAMGDFTHAAARIARSSDVESAPADTVDLSTEMLAILQARNAVEMNLQVMRTANEMSSELINLLA